MTWLDLWVSAHWWILFNNNVWLIFVQSKPWYMVYTGRVKTGWVVSSSLIWLGGHIWEPPPGSLQSHLANREPRTLTPNPAGRHLSDKRGIVDDAGRATQTVGMEQSDDGECWALLLAHEVWCYQHWLEGLHNLFGIWEVGLIQGSDVNGPLFFFFTLMKVHRSKWNFH